MPQPSISQVHVLDQLLTGISIGYQLDEAKFVADRVFPRVPVSKQTDRYLKWDRDAWFRTDAQERAPATESAGTGFAFSTDTYYARVYALHVDLADQVVANADDVVNLESNSTKLVTQQLLIQRDLKWLATFFTPGGVAGTRTSPWGTTRSGVAAGPVGTQFVQWNVGGSTPIADLRLSIVAQEAATGYRPNALVLGPRVWAKLIDHPDFIERIKYSERALVTTELLARVLEIDEVLIASAVLNSATEGAAAAFDFSAGKHALLLYRTPNAGLMVPSAGYIFTWNGYLGENAFGTAMKRFRMEQIASERIEGEIAYDMKVTAPDMGTFFADAVA
jgi:hypothetical protein